jgi:hypothetical protein
MDRHTLAIISIVGSCFDLLGALYLAYDLLGGEHGPLRSLSRGVTYGAMFAIGYAIPLGPIFGIVCGLSHGITLAWEFSAAARGQRFPGFWHDTAASAIRGLGFAVAGSWYFGLEFGLLFGAVSTISQVIAYSFGVRPTMNYNPSPRLRMSFTKLQVLALLNRTVGYGVLAWACARFVHQPQRAVDVGLRIGLAFGGITFVLGALTPLIEWGADQVPERRMGVFGVFLMVSGFLLQSVQYWISLLNVPVQ